jgi:competence protein ComEC
MRTRVWLRAAALGFSTAWVIACVPLQDRHTPATVSPPVSRTQVPQARKAIPPAAPVVAAPAGLPNDQSNADQMVVHFIDVGQGDAELLEFNCAAVLIDTGGESNDQLDGRQNLVNYLEEFFARRPDLARTLKLVVLSHPHIDHTNGVGTEDPPAALLGMKPDITIANVVDDGDAPEDASGYPGQSALREHVPAAHYFGVTEANIKSTSGLTNSIIDPVDCSSSGGIDPKITALWGRVDSSAGAWSKDENNNSVVLKVEFGQASFLFMGDLELPGIAAMLDSYSDDTSIFDSDVLKVGHHGSKNGTNEALLHAVTPKIAVMGVGDSSLSHATFSAYSYAHPNKVAIDLLLEAPDGVTLSRPGKKVSVGIKGADHKNHLPPTFEKVTLKKAIYATGWDGNIAVTANKDGTLSVQTGF